MIEALRGTDAIVFDLRGYPNGTAWPLAPYLNVNGATEWASFRRREVSHETYGWDTPTGFFFIQAIPQRDVEPYRGKTVMLIDERAISQSEHTAMMFQETAGTVMVGTPTAGANGDVTNFVLPGGVTVLFTGHDVRHADDSQLQQVGILPDIEAEPTIEGIRAGRDEVLEAALGHLRGELGPER
jgi:C-terminal processing protease CtpA/Prc